MMDPIKILQEEHKLLMKAVETASRIQKIEVDETYYRLLKDIIIFFKVFSEIFHYPKEENILYPVLLKYAKKMDSTFLNEISDNHDDLNSLMAEIETHYLHYDIKELRKTMNKHLVDLTKHVKRENKIILKTVNTLITDSEKQAIYDKFIELDKNNNKEEYVKNAYYIMAQVALLNNIN